MDLKSLLDNRPCESDLNAMREAQATVFANGLSALHHVSRERARDERVISAVAERFNATRKQNPTRILVAGPCYSWVMSAVRSRIQNPDMDLPPLDVGEESPINWIGTLPLCRLRPPDHIVRKLTTEAAFFHADGLELVPNALRNDELVGTWTSNLCKGLQILVDVMPEYAAIYPRFVEYHVPLQIEGAADHSVSITSRELPGVIGFSLMHPVLMAETLVHEGRHNILYALQEVDSLIHDSEMRLKSPWRGDLRPLGGLLHGAFVFEGVCQFYTRALNEMTMGVQNRKAAAKQFVRQAIGLSNATDTMRNVPDFTPEGKELLSLLDKAAIEHKASARRIAEDAGIPY